MICLAMKLRIPCIRSLSVAMVLCLAPCLVLTAFADKKPAQPVKPMAGPRAAALRVTWLYISPDKGVQKTGRVQIGREMVVM
jgi:hypothetical protein